MIKTLCHTIENCKFAKQQLQNVYPHLLDCHSMAKDSNREDLSRFEDKLPQMGEEIQKFDSE